MKVCNLSNSFWIWMVLILVLAFLYYKYGKDGSKEGSKESTIEPYRDPIYLNRYKLYHDWYPRTNGSIYGMCSNIFSGYPYYDSAI